MVRKLKFRKVSSDTQRFQLQEIANKEHLYTEEEVISFLITEYKTKYGENPQ